MHLVSFIKNQKTHVGILHGENSIIDLSFYENQVPNDVNQIIELNSLVKLKEIQTNPTAESIIKKLEHPLFNPELWQFYVRALIYLHYQDHLEPLLMLGKIYSKLS